MLDLITQDGATVRLIAADAEHNEAAGLEYEVGEVWEVQAEPAPEITPPHVENIVENIIVDAHTIRHFIRQGAPSEEAERTARLETLVQRAESNECRRRQILAYFGETTAADYGVGTELSASQWRHLAHQFLQQRLVEKESFGNLKVTPGGRQVLRGAGVRGTLTAAPFRGASDQGGDGSGWQGSRSSRRQWSASHWPETTWSYRIRRPVRRTPLLLARLLRLPKQIF